MPRNKGAEYRNMVLPFESTETNKRLDSECYVEGYAAIFDKPYELYTYGGVTYYEIIERNALDGVDLTDVIMNYDHEGRVLARTSNDTLIIELDDKGIFIAADLSKSDIARSIYEDIKNRLVRSMSWSFTQAESSSFNSETNTYSVSKVQKMFDVAAVSIPANDETSISQRSSVELEKIKERQEQIVLRKKKLNLKIKLLLEARK